MRERGYRWVGRNSGGNGCFYYPDSDGGFTGVHISKLLQPYTINTYREFPGGPVVKLPPSNAGDTDSIPWSAI